MFSFGSGRMHAVSIPYNLFSCYDRIAADASLAIVWKMNTTTIGLQRQLLVFYMNFLSATLLIIRIK